MVARKKKSTRRGPKYFNVYNAIVGYGNLAILTQGTLGAGPIEVVTSTYDIGYKSVGDLGLGSAATSMVMTGTDVISLADILNEPTMSFAQIMQNARANAVPMALQSVTFNVGARIFRKLMRRNFSAANRLIKPLGLNVRLG
jgi:hypothetical protein